MKLLAVETATDTCSVALGIGERSIERHVAGARRQTDLVLPMVEEVLAEAGCALSALDAITFSRGPGAFTGVRVSVSVAQGLGFAAGLPLIGLSTLAITAQTATQEQGAGDWLVALDARMGELYLAGFRTGEAGGPEVLIEERVCSPDDLPDLGGHDWRGAGSGAVHLPALRQAAPRLGQWHEHVGPRASAMLSLAAAAWRRGEAVPPDRAMPVYLRNQVIQGAVR